MQKKISTIVCSSVLVGCFSMMHLNAIALSDACSLHYVDLGKGGAASLVQLEGCIMVAHDLKMQMIAALKDGLGPDLAMLTKFQKKYGSIQAANEWLGKCTADKQLMASNFNVQNEEKKKIDLLELQKTMASKELKGLSVELEKINNSIGEEKQKYQMLKNDFENQESKLHKEIFRDVLQNIAITCDENSDLWKNRWQEMRDDTSENQPKEVEQGISAEDIEYLSDEDTKILEVAQKDSDNKKKKIDEDAKREAARQIAKEKQELCLQKLGELHDGQAQKLSKERQIVIDQRDVQLQAKQQEAITQCAKIEENFVSVLLTYFPIIRSNRLQNFFDVIMREEGHLSETALLQKIIPVMAQAVAKFEEFLKQQTMSAAVAALNKENLQKQFAAFTQAQQTWRDLESLLHTLTKLLNGYQPESKILTDLVNTAIQASSVALSTQQDLVAAQKSYESAIRGEPNNFSQNINKAMSVLAVAKVNTYVFLLQLMGVLNENIRQIAEKIITQKIKQQELKNNELQAVLATTEKKLNQCTFDLTELINKIGGFHAYQKEGIRNNRGLEEELRKCQETVSELKNKVDVSTREDRERQDKVEKLREHIAFCNSQWQGLVELNNSFVATGIMSVDVRA